MKKLRQETMIPQHLLPYLSSCGQPPPLTFANLAGINRVYVKETRLIDGKFFNRIDIVSKSKNL